MTLPRNLGQLVAQSNLIVEGRVLEARVESHPTLKNLATVLVTLRIHEVIKGNAGENFIFRQFIWDARDRLNAAGYVKGQELLLLLNPSTKLGFSTPAGLEQGRFRILRDQFGREYAINGHGNLGLFADVADEARARGLRLSPLALSLLEQPPKGPVLLNPLRDLIRELVGE
jgi:hypothetical protein